MNTKDSGPDDALPNRTEDRNISESRATCWPAATGGLNAMRSARGLTTWEVGPGADLTLRLSTGRPKTSPLGAS